jgi:hypothetical protein
LALVGALGVLAQTPPDWRKVGGSAVDLQLAAPATGPVARVWYAADGSALYAKTQSGKVFRTSDFETWSEAPNAGDAADDAAALPAVAAARLPEPGATLLAANSGSSRIFALGRQLWGSGDGGQTWLSLTAYKAAAVVGPGQTSVAVSPNDDREIVLANDFGVWRSMDGGLSWDGLNEFLPNLTVLRILSTPRGRHSRRDGSPGHAGATPRRFGLDAHRRGGRRGRGARHPELFAPTGRPDHGRGRRRQHRLCGRGGRAYVGLAR